MKPGVLVRKTPMRRTRGTTWPPEVAQEIAERDEGRCVGPRIGMPEVCLGQPQKDHVRPSGGLGMKSRSTTDNGALLCARHHEMKTNDGPKWRPPILAYTDRKARLWQG